MIKTLIAVGLTTLCGLNNVRIETEDNSYIVEGEQEYTGEEAQEFLATHKFKYIDNANNNDVYQNIYNNDTTDAYTFSGINAGEHFETYLLLEPMNAYDSFKIIKCGGIWTDGGSDMWTYLPNGFQNVGGITYSIEDYQPRRFLIEEKLAKQYPNRYVTISYVRGGGTVYTSFPYNTGYSIKSYYINADFLPLKDMATNNNYREWKWSNYGGSLAEAINNLFPNYTSKMEIQKYLTMPFIASGSYFTNAWMKGTITPQLGSSEIAIIDYSYLIFENTTQIYQLTANSRDWDGQAYINSNSWYLEGKKIVTILFSEKVDLINLRYQTQDNSFSYHIGLAGTTELNGDGAVGDVFTILGNAFTGFGKFFSVMILPGITLGTLITIPLLLGIILWLIHMFKRGG